MRNALRFSFTGFVVLFFMFMGVVIYKFLSKDNGGSAIHTESEIVEQLNNVSKLVVTEANFAEVITYKDQQKYFLDLLSFHKKAIVVVNAKATVSYDMSELKYQIDQKNKRIQLINLPLQEISIYPEFSIYDIESSTFNPFVGEDYNKIKRTIEKQIEAKIEKSTLKTNAENRFISELSKILILTNTMGWTLEYQGNRIENQLELQADIKL